ncbi:MAG: patatin-like phospholipase family protein [Chitinophagaceae bacterium]|nr:patatin-like phospholipase family protein [Chitinophagaceae bacterium]
MPSLQQHLGNDTNQKRILSLDGGGIRGAITIGYLEVMEKILSERHKNVIEPDKFRLSDYFDLIGGTSTGSIIAACLAIGMRVSDIKEKYFKLGGMIFEDKNKIWDLLHIRKALRARFDEKNLKKHLSEAFSDGKGGDILLGGAEIKTGLCVFAKRADTNSTWTLNNHPAGRFFNDTKLGENGKIPLKDVVRASTAAPTYFIPEIIDVGNKQNAAFVDGGVSTANNPALYLLMVATLKGFPFKWQAGEENIFLVSLGTGTSSFNTTIGDITDNWMLSWASSVPDMLMQDASWLNQVLLQWMSRSDTKKQIDLQIGKMENDMLGNQPVLTYNRYNVDMTIENLKRLGFEEKKDYQSLSHIVEMSNGDNVETLYKIGAADAASDVKAEHFRPSFDLKSI